MELLIALLMYLGVYATPENLQNDEFCNHHQTEIDRANDMASNGQYYLRDGIVVGGGTSPKQ